ncbi:MAG: hypothetical protein ACMUJM_19815 [bacterium]
MHRTQIYFNEKEWSLLKLLASNKKQSVSELVRTAVNRYYFIDKKVDLSKALDDIAGLWSDRDINTQEHIRSLRKGSRTKYYADYP